MNIFTYRLLRLFGIGFAVGALAVAALSESAQKPGGGQFLPAAIAAPAR